LHLGVMDIW